jgi:NAD(P)H-dependent flavin oxidoreductase YrpB (nitropropane dioxygenase family)
MRPPLSLSLGQAVRLGYDFVIIQGTEAGGHTGDVSLFPLLPQVLDAVGAQVPVVAAGGIYDGRGLAAALAMGTHTRRMHTHTHRYRDTERPRRT